MEGLRDKGGEGKKGRDKAREGVDGWGVNSVYSSCQSVLVSPPLQHFIFLGVAVIAWIIPDVPEAVQQEIKKEKLLALEATLKAKGGGGGAEGGNEVSAL